MSVVDDAARDLYALLRNGRVELNEVRASMHDLGHPPDRIPKAKRRLGVRLIRTGAPGTEQVCYWELRTACRACGRPFEPGGWDVSDFDALYQAHTEEPEPEVIAPTEPAPAVKPRPAFRSPDGPSTCVLCGRSWMLPPESKCMTLRCQGWTE